MPTNEPTSPDTPSSFDAPPARDAGPGKWVKWGIEFLGQFILAWRQYEDNWIPIDDDDDDMPEPPAALRDDAPRLLTEAAWAVEHFPEQLAFWSEHEPRFIAESLRRTRDHIRGRKYQEVDLDELSKRHRTLESAIARAEAKPATEGNSEDGALDIDLWLEETIHLLNTSDSEKWITSVSAARLLKVEVPALREERSKKRAKFRHSQGTCGIVGNGHWWRKEPGKQDVWYYLPSLTDGFKHRDA